MTGQRGFDNAVEVTADIDRYCSTSEWVLPAAVTFLDDVDVVTAERNDAAILLVTSTQAGGSRLIGGGDLLWQFASPVAGPDPEEAALLLRDGLLDAGAECDIGVVTGLVEDSPLWNSIVAALLPHLELRLGDQMTRCLADLSGGLEPFLERRSAKFRKNLRRCGRLAEEAGIEFVVADQLDPNVSIDRILDVEKRSWKGDANAGLMSSDMVAFYRAIGAHVGPEDRFRVTFARVDGTDVGYIMGAVRNGIYRGFQLGYAADQQRLSLGNLLQHAQMQTLVEEGVHTYDLGMDMEYKQAWADDRFTTATIIAGPQGRRRTLGR